ncbi:hypothetical protein LUZ60_005454 [Juncus effusus]|nr:hypothetical protein LUZ60_005454 [Juncus effusus]
MGQETQENFSESLHEILTICDGSNFKGHKTTTELNDKIYVIGASSEETDSQLEVKIFDKTTQEWLVPTVLGTKPTASKFHSAVPINNERILILKGDSNANDFAYFLEVDTKFIRERKNLFGETETLIAWSKISFIKTLNPIVISGPSGVGKGTLISKLMTEFPAKFGFSVSHTTRGPREGERNGVHYHFSERNKMERDIKEGKFLETALVHGNLYGTSAEAVEAVSDTGKRCILDIDVQGARSVRSTNIEAVFLFIRPPSFEDLEKRLRGRGTETEEQIQKRLRNAKQEMEEGKLGLFDHVLINDDLESCYNKLKKLLDLEDGVESDTTSDVVDFKAASSFTVSRDTDKIIVYSENGASKEGIPEKIVLDVSSLKGGAPGRTRGISISTEY